MMQVEHSKATSGKAVKAISCSDRLLRKEKHVKNFVFLDCAVVAYKISFKNHIQGEEQALLELGCLLNCGINSNS